MHYDKEIDMQDINQSNLKDNELEFYYFKTIDTDGNSMIDGTELCKSAYHWHG